MFAAAEGKDECVKFLIEKGADLGAQDSEGRTALHFACSNLDSETLDSIIESINNAGRNDLKEVRTVGGQTPLMFAIRTGNAPFVA